MAFPERFLDELTERNDIVDVVSQYVRLTKKSGANLFGLCPFHSEKTPSFSVAPDKQIYHCFGCGKGGGVINFIMEIENLSFPDAVAFLARRANMPLPEEAQSEDTSRRARLLELNRDAARFFHDMLKSPQGAPAQDYVRRRAISPAMVTRFGLGFAPDSWESLANAMRRKGYSDQEMFEAGLVKHGKSGGVYDAFRNRLMFPVIDVRGSVIGFSGRILGDGEPKYLNSPETPVFSKSHNLFGLNLAKKSKNGYIILVEGNIDVVSLHQAGFDGAVASLGTSLTPEQARLISRYTNEVVLCYDSDEAGKKAASRGIGILEKLDLKVRVLQVPGAKDPDEFLRKYGADRFSLLLDQSENQAEYRLQSLRRKYDLTQDDQRVAFLTAAAEMVSTLQNAVEREVYGRRAAEAAGVSYDAIKLEVQKAFKKRIAREKKKQEVQDLSPAKQQQPRIKGIRYDNVRSAMAEEGLLRLVLKEPSLFSSVTLRPEQFSCELLGRAYAALAARNAAGQSVTLGALEGEFSPEEMAHLSAVAGKDDQIINEDALRDYVDVIRQEDERRNRRGGDALLALAAQRREQKGYGG